VISHRVDTQQDSTAFRIQPEISPNQPIDLKSIFDFIELCNGVGGSAPTQHAGAPTWATGMSPHRDRKLTGTQLR
jgi:hypothetical protein